MIDIRFPTALQLMLTLTLAAVLSADVKGYNRLMGDDEEGTLRTLNVYRLAVSM